MGFTRTWAISCGCIRILDARKGKIALISLNPAPTHTYRYNRRNKCITNKTGNFSFLWGKQSLFTAINAIDEGLNTTGKCQLATAKRTESIPGSLAWALPKRSPYNKVFIKG